MTFQHLRDRSYYEDLYDRFTVEDCRWHEEWEPPQKEQKEGEEHLSPKQIQFFYTFANDFHLFHLVGDRYLAREKTINEWMERDRERDTLIANARRPLVRCQSCGRAMDYIDSHLHYGERNGRDSVEFFFGCKPCKKTIRVLEDGTVIPRKPILCSKCKKEVECSTRTEGEKIFFIETCKHCGHVEETIDEEKPPPTQEEIERFERDKKRFCLTPEQGQRYKYYLERTGKMETEKKEHEQNIEFDDKLADIKKLNIAGLEKRLRTATKKVGFEDLHISMPPNERVVIIEFSVRDTQEERREQESTKALEKTINTLLEDTNWSLLSSGVMYRLGMLSGRIQGYETEDQLKELTKSRMKKLGRKKNVLA